MRIEPPAPTRSRSRSLIIQRAFFLQFCTMSTHQRMVHHLQLQRSYCLPRHLFLIILDRDKLTVSRDGKHREQLATLCARKAGPPLHIHGIVRLGGALRAPPAGLHSTASRKAKGRLAPPALSLLVLQIHGIVGLGGALRAPPTDALHTTAPSKSKGRLVTPAFASLAHHIHDSTALSGLEAHCEHHRAAFLPLVPGSPNIGL